MKTSNFLEFVTEDIGAKKTLFSTMPVNNKRNIKKFNDKIDLISKTYEEYRVSVKKYLDTKAKSLNIKTEEKSLDELVNKVNSLEKVRFILNPLNTYVEKMGFDNLLYQMSNYSDFDFEVLNDIINQFLDKFELAGKKLSRDDFNYTYYVNEYMTAFLEVRNKKSDNYDKVSEMFEKIYWANPEIIGHIELNFRKLIRKNEKNFVSYIFRLQSEEMKKSGVNNYEDCLEKLKRAYNELNDKDKETVSDILASSKNGEIDIYNYFKDSKLRVSTYSSLMIDHSELENSEAMSKFYESLNKMKINVEEFINYNKFLPLIDDFKLEYEKQLPGSGSNSNVKNSENKSARGIESQIIDLENKLEKMNKKIFSGKNMIFGGKSNNDQIKFESIKQAKKLYELYKLYDVEYFKNRISQMLNSNMTISELLHLYYSFDYFKKSAIKRVFNIAKYNELIKYSESFDLFAMNPNNIIVDSINIFEQTNIAKIIMNKYRLVNINLNEENLSPDELSSLLEKIEYMLRINTVENSETTVEKIWFITQVDKINKTVNKTE